MPPILNFFHMGMSHQDVALRFMGVYEAQFRGLRQAGATVRFTPDAPDPQADFIICTSSSSDIHVAAQSTCPLILYVPPTDQWFDAALLASLRDRIRFVYGPVLSDFTAAQYRALGITYHFLPFAADPQIMRPLNLAPRYDVAFLGGLQHRRGYQPYIEPLLKALDPNRLAFIGGNWEKKYHLPVLSVDGLSADHPGPPERGILTNNLYNLARVCINFHAPEETRGRAIQLDCNNRLFDLAMAGCVQVSDNPDAVRMHFSEGEVFAEGSPEAWVQRVLDCLALSDAQLAGIRAAARARAQAEHTWAHRGQTFLSWL